MKMHWIVLCMSMLCMALCALPVLAQGARQRNGMPGRVLAVDAGQRQLTIALYVKAANPDAPGKVPDEMARQAAGLSRQAERLETQGKTVMAKNMRSLIDELLSWREVELRLTLSDQRLLGIQRNALTEIATGDTVGTEVSISGALPTGKAPLQTTQAKDVMQVAATAKPSLRVLDGDPRIRTTFLRVVGRVTATEPLTLDVDGRTVRITASPSYAFIRSTTITPRDVKPGQRIIARGSAPRANAIHTLLVFGENVEMPFAPDEDFEL